MDNPLPLSCMSYLKGLTRFQAMIGGRALSHDWFHNISLLTGLEERERERERLVIQCVLLTSKLQLQDW